MDVLALAQLGFPQSVATLGTACTKTHMNKLFRQTDSVVFSFDGDNAGRKAAKNLLETCLRYAVDSRTIKFLFLPQEHDPDSFVRKMGEKAFNECIQNAMPLSQFLLNEVKFGVDLSTPEGRARVQFNAKRFIKIMPPSSFRLQIVYQLSQITQSTPNEIEHLFELVNPATVRKKIVPSGINRPEPIDLEQRIISLLSNHPTLIEELDSNTALEIFTHFKADHLKIIRHLITASPKMAVRYSHENKRCAELSTMEAKEKSKSVIKDVRSEFLSAICQVKIRIFKNKLDKISENGLNNKETYDLYRALMEKQKELKSQLQSGMNKNEQ